MSLQIRILFDETHNEGGKLNSTYSHLRKLLERNQMEPVPLTDFPITFDKIKRYDLLVIAGPDMSKFRINEINDIVTYVKNGGKLLVMSDAGGDRGHMTNLNKLVSYFGVQFNADQVIDPNSNLGIETVPIIKNIREHKITEGISSIS
ncbi:MAG: Gldg family protein, partial [Candidatus Odinarchaeia archaeon]